MKKIFAILMPLALFICCDKEEKTAHETAAILDNQEVRKEIKLLEANFAEAINDKNLAGIANYYADDAESYLTGSEVLKGKDAILKSTASDFKTMSDDDKVEYTMTDLFISNDGNQAVEMGSYKATNSRGILERKGNFMAVFAKRNGKFKCIRDIDCPQ